MALTGTPAPKDMEGFPEETRKRLHFQLEAAGVQSDASTLIVHVTELFRRLYDEPRFSKEDGERAASWAEESRKLKERWDALEPPTAAAGLVKQISGQFADLNRLFDEVVWLEGAVGDDLAERVSGLQADFNSQLALMNRTEQRLLHVEKKLGDNERR